jgi:hypothetical protein
VIFEADLGDHLADEPSLPIDRCHDSDGKTTCGWDKF